VRGIFSPLGIQKIFRTSAQRQRFARLCRRKRGANERLWQYSTRSAQRNKNAAAFPLRR
jgi:hypothetical protein